MFKTLIYLVEGDTERKIIEVLKSELRCIFHKNELGDGSMLVKARRVGNSFALTIPSSIVEVMSLADGQEMLVDYNEYSKTLSYRPNKVCEIDWAEFTAQDSEDIRDGMSPEDYVRHLRDFDREEIVF